MAIILQKWQKLPCYKKYSLIFFCFSPFFTHGQNKKTQLRNLRDTFFSHAPWFRTSVFGLGLLAPCNVLTSQSVPSILVKTSKWSNLSRSFVMLNCYSILQVSCCKISFEEVVPKISNSCACCRNMISTFCQNNV